MRTLAPLALLALGGAAAAQDDPEAALRKLRVAPGLKASLWAAEPQLANPVAIAFDEKGRLFVVETHRIGTSVYDIRNYMHWLDDDLACRTVEDRERMYRKHLGKDAEKLAVESERLRLLEDRDGDGRAEIAQTFAENFGAMADGLAAGVLAHQGDVWFASIPALWLLKDSDGDGKADLRKALHTGYGVHLNYIGHDLHGLILGPDGKLYFSIGDRGLNVETQGKRLFNPDSGAILRCSPDGSDLEIVATGLRNPQELAFDQHGNLFTWDNNSDWHDMARWVYVVEGLDAGWRLGYQFLPGRGPWEAERIWEAGADVPYRLPPLANIDHGPSGIAFYPGTGLPDRYENRFLLCNFPGGLNTWGVEPRGASFQVVDRGEFLWNVWATDVAFGPDGAAYVADWGEGWSKKGLGRIYRVHDPAGEKDPAVLEVRRLLSEGLSRRESGEVSALLGHRDQRVRQEAQFELAGRGAGAIRLLAEVVGQANTQRARLHAIWALGQIGARSPEALERVATFARNPDSEVRAQVARVLGDRRFANGFETLSKLMEDASPRVRFLAALGLGRIGAKEGFDLAVDLLRRNENQDPYLRHAGVMALAGTGDADRLLRLAGDGSGAVRLGALLALRRLERPEIQAFLQDRDPAIVLEAARAIYDVPIEGSLGALAALLEGPGCPEAVLPRAIQANARLGTDKAAGALSWFARRHDFGKAARAEALLALAEWDRPPGRDRLIGVWRPAAPKDPEAARRWVRPLIGGLLQDPVEEVQLEAIRFEAAAQWEEGVPVLVDVAKSPATSRKARVEALRGLSRMGDARLRDAVEAGLRDADLRLREEAVRLLPKAGLPDAPARLERLASEGPMAVRQAAVAALGSIEAGGGAVARLSKDPPAALRVDLEEAAARRGVAGPAPADAGLLEGGDAAAGRAAYVRSDCGKCHKVRQGGGTVGPALTTVAARLVGEKLLQAIVDPNAEIAQGYEQLLVQLASGDVKAGKVERRTASAIILMDAEGRLEAIPLERVRATKPGKSAMPEDFARRLSRRDLRDLVAFLGTLKGADPKAAPLEPGAVVADDEDAGAFRTEGNWRTDTTGGDWGRHARWAFPDATGRSRATWTAELRPGRYKVWVWVSPDPLAEHAGDAPWTVSYDGGEQTVRVDQAREAGTWKLLGAFAFGSRGRVTLSSAADNPVFGDAVKFVPD
jgi:quinoprotein glucose dehydrogenase